VAARREGRHRSHFGRIDGKPPPLQVAPADFGIVPPLRRSAAFELRHRSLPLGIRHRDLGRRRLAPVAEVAADYKPVADEHIQSERAPALMSGKSTIFSFCNLASSHLMHSQVCRVPLRKSFLHQRCRGIYSFARSKLITSSDVITPVSLL
jgi:hypothetical protein